MAMEFEDPFQSERRATDRFPLENELRYKLLEAKRIAHTGRGRTLNMSSDGILFTAEAPLPVGQRVELSVDWPAQLNEHCGLKLVALGKIVRADRAQAAVRIEKYDFHTRAAAAVAGAGGIVH
jgi:hypothetical protein